MSSDTMQDGCVCDDLMAGDNGWACPECGNDSAPAHDHRDCIVSLVAKRTEVERDNTDLRIRLRNNEKHRGTLLEEIDETRADRDEWRGIAEAAIADQDPLFEKLGKAEERIEQLEKALAKDLAE